MPTENYLKAIRSWGFTATVIPAADIVVNPEFRQVCEKNQCGRYNTCYTCPPAVGSTETCIRSLKQFGTAVAVQYTQPVEDSFDWEGMMNAKKHFQVLFRRALKKARSTWGSRVLALGPGGCDLCAECTWKEQKPCKHPELALASLEGYCIDAAKTAENAGIPLRREARTVAYYGLILF